MQTNNNELALALEPMVSTMYDRMPHAARLDIVTLPRITELVAEGYPIHASRSSNIDGILNHIGVTVMSFNKWMLRQDSHHRDDFNTALLTQSLALKQDMLEAALDSVRELDRAVLISDDPSDMVKASSAKANVALKVLEVLDKEHKKAEKEAPTQAKEIKAEITSTDEARQRLLQLRADKAEDAQDG